MQVVLVMFRADGERRSFSLPREVTVIGRREDCDLRIPLGDVSRKHCRLIQEADTLRLEDLGSSNGTYHNGQRIQEAIISPGDTIQIGPVVFVVQIDGVPTDDELQPFDAAAAVAAASTAGAEAIDADELEEVADGDEILEEVSGDQEQTITGSGAADFDPMEILSSDEEDEDEQVDFIIEDDETDDSVHIDLDSDSGRQE